jgi:hypothetical protein
MWRKTSTSYIIKKEEKRGELRDLVAMSPTIKGMAVHSIL